MINFNAEFMSPLVLVGTNFANLKGRAAYYEINAEFKVTISVLAIIKLRG